MFGFIVAVIAGFVTPMIEAPVARPVAKIFERYITLEASETRVIAFMIALLGAAIISALLDSGSTFLIVLGASIGYFLTRFVAAGRAAADARKN